MYEETTELSQKYINQVQHLVLTVSVTVLVFCRKAMPLIYKGFLAYFDSGLGTIRLF